MPLAFILGLSDFLVIALLIVLIIGMRIVSIIRYDDPGQLDRVEWKLDVLLATLRIDLSKGQAILDQLDEEEPRVGIAPFRAYSPEPGKEEWQELALQGAKVMAIKSYRDQYGVSLNRSKHIVEAYIKKNKPPG